MLSTILKLIIHSINYIINNIMKKNILTKKSNIENIEEIASFLRDIVKDGNLIIMKGNLGFGKTTFARIFAKLLKSEDIVSSPSFTLINEYDIILKNEETILRHVDLYRLSSKEELDNIGFKDKIKENGITMIEWGDKFESYFDKPYYEIEIEMTEEDSRLYRINLIS